MQTSTTEETTREKTPKSREGLRNIGKVWKLVDIVIFFIGAVLGRTHLAFGAYPFGIAFLCALPHHVFVGLAGAVAGALSRGRSGILFAMIAFIALFVRILISGAEKASENGGMFREPLTLRMSAGAIGGFVSAVYELLSRGIVTESVLFSLTMIFGVALSTVAFGLVFSYPITLNGALFHTTGLFHFREDKTYRRKKNLCIFSVLCYLVALCFGLSGIELFGVSLGGIFAFGVTLFVSRRFGAVCGAVVGFLCGVVIAPDFAVACALCGVTSGLLFSYGTLAGEVCVVATSALWGVYTGGALGLLSLLPEGLIGTMLLHPLLIRISPEVEKSEKENPSAEERAKELLEKNISTWVSERPDGESVPLSDALLNLSVLLHTEEDRSAFPSEAQYRALLEASVETRCKTCRFFEGCDKGKTGFFLSLPDLVRKLMSHRPPEAEDIGICADREGRGAFAEALRIAVGRAEEDKYQNSRRTPVGDLVRTFGEMTKEVTSSGAQERYEDTDLSGRLSEALREVGLMYAEAKVYGRNQRQIFISAMDTDGTKISSSEVHKEISKVLGGAVLGTPSYVRSGEYVLMRLVTQKNYALRCASAVLPVGQEGISGDVIHTYEGAKGQFRGILCDGMGTGARAREGAKFVVDVLKTLLDCGATVPYVLRLVDEVMRRRNPEDGTTLDLFSLNLYTGKAEFYKLGAVSSFIKRGDSLFSIRSNSLPLGLCEGAFHGEKISASVENGDIVVLFSDGISSQPEQTPWLLEFLAHTKLTDPKTIAEQIILHAKREDGQKDDMSVLVCRVEQRT